MEYNPKYWPNKVLIPLIVAVSFVGGFFGKDILRAVNVLEVPESDTILCFIHSDYISLINKHSEINRVDVIIQPEKTL